MMAAHGPQFYAARTRKWQTSTELLSAIGDTRLMNSHEAKDLDDLCDKVKLVTV